MLSPRLQVHTVVLNRVQLSNSSAGFGNNLTVLAINSSSNSSSSSNSNSTGGSGGAIALTSVTAARLHNVTARAAAATLNGGFLASFNVSVLVLTKATVTATAAVSGGGGALSHSGSPGGTAVFWGVRLPGPHASLAGGGAAASISETESVFLIGSRIAAAQAWSSGGGLRLAGVGRAYVAAVDVVGASTAAGGGGCVAAEAVGVLQLRQSALLGCSAPAEQLPPLAAVNAVTNSTFSLAAAASLASALALSTAASAAVAAAAAAAAVAAGATAAAAGAGGGLFASSVAVLHLQGCVIAGNAAAAAGGGAHLEGVRKQLLHSNAWGRGPAAAGGGGSSSGSSSSGSSGSSSGSSGSSSSGSSSNTAGTTGGALHVLLQPGYASLTDAAAAREAQLLAAMDGIPAAALGLKGGDGGGTASGDSGVLWSEAAAAAAGPLVASWLPVTVVPDPAFWVGLEAPAQQSAGVTPARLRQRRLRRRLHQVGRALAPLLHPGGDGDGDDNGDGDGAGLTPPVFARSARQLPAAAAAKRPPPPAADAPPDFPGPPDTPPTAPKPPPRLPPRPPRPPSPSPPPPPPPRPPPPRPLPPSILRSQPPPAVAAAGAASPTSGGSSPASSGGGSGGGSSSSGSGGDALDVQSDIPFLDIDGDEFVGNQGAAGGGAVHVVVTAAAARVRITHSTFTGNTAGQPDPPSADRVGLLATRVRSYPVVSFTLRPHTPFPHSFSTSDLLGLSPHSQIPFGSFPATRAARYGCSAACGRRRAAAATPF